MVNFLPREPNRILYDHEGNIIQITAKYSDGRDLVFKVIDGKPRRSQANDVPFFEIPENDLESIYRQIGAVISSRKKTQRLARRLKRPTWTFDLEKYGVMIEVDGCLKISRWITEEETGIRKQIWLTVKDINAAIRMQDHIIEKYLAKKHDLENNQGAFPESDLLKKFSVVLPYIEMRRQLLIHAQRQMELSIHRAINGLKIIMPERGTNKEICHDLPGKLYRLTFFLKNNWPNPYREKVDQIIPYLKKARRLAVNFRAEETKAMILAAKEILLSTFEAQGRQQSSLTEIAKIEPIQILARVDRLGLADEVMVIAKRILPEPYYLPRLGLFRLSGLLAISFLVIEGKNFINQEDILKLCR
jgi:hypothetical protein